MATPTSDLFAKRLLAEALFYDQEFGAVGTISLIDSRTAREMYVAGYIPEEQAFVIEAASDWEDLDEEEVKEIGYSLAI
ncbi:MAG: hypothetical protein HKN13_09645, partial [Rhodothermales bacterium]|nr:hypothetical protein [Rhodothermales bacterium]